MRWSQLTSQHLCHSNSLQLRREKYFCYIRFPITTLLLKELKLTNKINLLILHPAHVPFILLFISTFFVSQSQNTLASSLATGRPIHAVVTYTMNYHHEREWWSHSHCHLVSKSKFCLLWPLLLTTLGRLNNAKSAVLAEVLHLSCIRYWMWFVLVFPSDADWEFQANGIRTSHGAVLLLTWAVAVYTPSCFSSRCL